MNASSSTDAGRLILEDVRKRYPGNATAALDGVGLVVEAGRILVLLGSSGAGKTTLLRVIAGLEDADAGRVRLGTRVLSDPRARVSPERRGVGLVFQHLELWPHMTVAENIAFGLPGRPRGRRAMANETVRTLARQVGVEQLLARSPGTLSGGERQRVAIARTLAPEPAVILYDEPLANLDPERRADLRRLIRGLCRDRGTTLVYVTHDADDAMEMGDEIAVLHAGRVVDQGPPDRLYHRPRTLAAARALGPMNVLPVDVQGAEVDTVLGRIRVGEDAPRGRGAVVLRPEVVRVVEDGVEARVVETRPRGPAWALRAQVGETTLLGICDAAIERDRKVRLEAVLEDGAPVIAGEEAWS